MDLQFPPVNILYLCSAMLAWYVAYRSWQQGFSQKIPSWTFVPLSMGLWSFGAMLVNSVTTLNAFEIASRIHFLGIVATVVSWGIFNISYSQYERWLNRRFIVVLFIPAVVFYSLVLTSHWHEWIFVKPELVTLDSGYIFFDLAPAFGFWIWTAYAYTFVLVGTGSLVFSILLFPLAYRGQAVLLLTGVLLPMIANVIYLVVGVRLLGPYDPTSIFYSISGITMLLAMNRYQFLSVVPVAYDLVYKGVNSGVLVLDEAGHIMDINPMGTKIVGKTAEEVLGVGIIELFPEERDLIMRFQDVHETKTEISIRERYYELQLMPLVNRRGKRKGRILMLYDITEQKQAQQELNAYAHMVAHDLKNPLSVVRGYADFLETKARTMPPEQIDERLRKISTNAHKMQAIIDDLLLLASIRNPRDLQMEAVMMGPLINDVVGRLGDQIETSQAQIILPTKWHTAKGYAPWIEEIWANYLSNGIKYGGHPPILELGSRVQPDGRIYFYVKDNGQGITTAEQNQLFTLFSRLDKHTEQEGHGLGLSIVWRIAQKLGGEVGVESAAGQGSTFYFVLPPIEQPILMPTV